MLLYKSIFGKKIFVFLVSCNMAFREKRFWKMASVWKGTFQRNTEKGCATVNEIEASSNTCYWTSIGGISASFSPFIFYGRRDLRVWLSGLLLSFRSATAVAVFLAKGVLFSKILCSSHVTSSKQNLSILTCQYHWCETNQDVRILKKITMFDIVIFFIT